MEVADGPIQTRTVPDASGDCQTHAAGIRTVWTKQATDAVAWLINACDEDRRCMLGLPATH